MNGRPGVRPHLLFRGLDPHGHLDIPESTQVDSRLYAVDPGKWIRDVRILVTTVRKDGEIA